MDSRCLVVISVILLLQACASTDRASQTPRELDSAKLDQQLIALASAQLKERRYRAAAERFEEVLARAPDRVEARLGLAEARLGAGDLAAAQELFQAVLNEHPDDAAAREGLAVAQFASGDVDAARANLARVIEADQERWRSWHVLAQIHDQTREFEAVDQAYATALRLAPRPAAVHNNWGLSLLERGRDGAALEQFEAALRTDPGSAVARTNMELAYGFMGRYDDVIAMTSEDQLPRVLNNLGYVAMQKGDLERAEIYFVRALQESPSFYLTVWRNLQQLQRLKRSTALS
jgi:Tfp pilus assembly protein PilF